MPSELTKALELILSQYFFKILAACIFLYGMTVVKSILLGWFVRNRLIKMEAIHVDKYVKIGDVEGTVERIGITHLKMKTEDGAAYVPNKYLLERALILAPKMEKKLKE